MNENIIDLLVYLFENYLYDNEDTDLPKSDIQQGLNLAGFDHKTIKDAFQWIDDLKQDINVYQKIQINTTSFRVFNSKEKSKINADCMDFIYYLNNTKIIDNNQREILINAIMKLECEQIDIDDLHWLTLMVLFSQPEQHQAMAELESMMFDTEQLYDH